MFVVNGTVALHSIYTTEVRRAIASKHTHANTDPLTGIANRRAFSSRARDLIEANEDAVDVMLIDVDNFKMVNDTHGHDRGDEILIDVALAILAAVDSTAVVARLGGDEFAVAASAVDGRQHAAKTLRDKVVEQCGILVSVGWAAVEPGAADSSDALSTAVAAADIDLYAAKSARTKFAD
jgi:diguanylate cyclase (GGDEF)-like protein